MITNVKAFMRNRDTTIPAASMFLMLVAACSSAPARPTLTTRDGDHIVIPPACEVSAAGQSPYSVTFRLHNSDSSSVFLHTGCFAPFQVASCASGYTDQLANLDVCPCLCNAVCPFCGECYPDGAEAIEPDATKEWPWTATLLVNSRDGTNKGTSCKTSVDLPAGRYRVSIPLFATAENGLAQTPVLHTATADFQLPAGGDTIQIETR